MQVGVRVFPWLLKRVEDTGSRELFTLAVVALALGVAFGSAFLSSAPAIVLYHAHRNEVSTDSILADALASGRAVFYPRVDAATSTIVSGAASLSSSR